jgi:hypothetical protein
MRLNPDLELLERIGILSNPFLPYLHRGSYQMEVEEKDFETLSPFLICWGVGEALQELFFYQLNFVPICEPPKPQTLQAIQEDRTYFQSREKLEKMDFSQLKGIKLHFGKDSKGNGINADLPPRSSVFLWTMDQKATGGRKPERDHPSRKAPGTSRNRKPAQK